MQARLKEYILREAKRYDGTIMVIHEIDNGETFDAWENVNDEAFLTLLEVYKRLDSEDLPVKYASVPTTDGKAPKSSKFDTVAMNIATACKEASLVFNCQTQLFSASCQRLDGVCRHPSHCHAIGN